jgi:hypothetical protein
VLFVGAMISLSVSVSVSVCIWLEALEIGYMW